VILNLKEREMQFTSDDRKLKRTIKATTWTEEEEEEEEGVSKLRKFEIED
jgi:hypothetical protein